MKSRRDLAKLLLGGVAAAELAGFGASASAQASLPTQIAGHDVGICLFNFRSMPRLADQMAYVDSLIAACIQCGVAFVEINSTNLEPANDLPFTGLPRIQDFVLKQQGPWTGKSRPELDAEREALRKWRLDPANLAYFSEVGRQMRRAGLVPYSYVMTFYTDMTDAEIDAVFSHAKTLGVRAFSTNQTKVEVAPRLVAPAERYGIDVALHNHTQADNPNEFASIESFQRVLPLSPRMRVNLDIGQATAADINPVEFLRQFSERITHLHLKDKRRHEGPATPWGEGDTPIREVIRLVKEKGWTMPFFPELEHRFTGTPVEETRKSFDFIRRTLT